MSLFEIEAKEFGDYLFSSGELTEREREFLTKEEFERMLSSQTKEDFLRVLNETYYSKYVEDARKSGSLESMTEQETVLSIEYLREHLMEGHRNLIEFLILDRDIHNVKVIMKSDYLKKDLKHIFLRSSYTFDDLKSAYDSKDASKLLSPIKDVMEKLFEILDGNQDFRIIELKLEQFFFEKLTCYVASSKSEPLIELFKHRVDMLNIKNVYRAKVAGEKFKYDEFLYEGGKLDSLFFRQFENESVDFFAQSIERGEYTKMIMQGTHLLYSEDTFASFEKNEEEFITRFFFEASKSSTSLERVLGFFIRKRFEARSLNIIFSGIANNIAREKIKHRIPGL
ncbi:MAG: V-type ATPase subunit [bacterium]|nr:V-type ATPase subunit [bacterium]